MSGGGCRRRVFAIDIDPGGGTAGRDGKGSTVLGHTRGSLVVWEEGPGDVNLALVK